MVGRVHGGDEPKDRVAAAGQHRELLGQEGEPVPEFVGALLRNTGMTQRRPDSVVLAVVDPDEGFLACGDYGKGRLASSEAILEAVRTTLGS